MTQHKNPEAADASEPAELSEAERRDGGEARAHGDGRAAPAAEPERPRLSEVDAWIYFDGPEPKHMRPLLDALRSMRPSTPEDKVRIELPPSTPEDKESMALPPLTPEDKERLARRVMERIDEEIARKGSRQ